MKGRVLLLMMLSLLCAKMDAGIWGWWRGEQFSGNGEYYIYSWNSDVNKRGFLSHATVDGVLRPVLVEASLAQGEGGDLFYQENPGKNHQLQYNVADQSYTVHIFENKALGSDQYLKVPFTDSGTKAIYDEGLEYTNLLTYGTKSTQNSYNNGEFGVDPATGVKESDNSSVQAYYVFFQKRIGHNRMHLKGYGLNQKVGFYRQQSSSVDDNNCLWLFISKKQYESRISLSNFIDVMDAKVKAGGTLTEKEQKAYDDAMSALTSETFNETSTDQAYSEMQDANASFKNLNTTVNNLTELNEKYKSVTGSDNAELVGAINEAKAVIANGKSSNDFDDANTAATSVYNKWDGIVNTDIVNLGTTISNLENLNSQYKALTGQDNQEILDAISTAKTDATSKTTSEGVQEVNTVATDVYNKWTSINPKIEELNTEIDKLESLNSAYKENTGCDDPALIDAITTAKEDAKSADSVGNVTTAISNVKSVYTTRKNAIESLDYTYYKEVRLQAAALNYSLSDEDKTTINNASTQALIYDAAESLRAHGIQYVKDYTNNGGAYPKDTKFTLFVKNSSFTRGDYSNSSKGGDVTIPGWTTEKTWEDDDSYNSGTTGINTNGNYYDSNENISFAKHYATTWQQNFGRKLKQEITDLPKGQYKLSVNYYSSVSNLDLYATTTSKEDNKKVGGTTSSSQWSSVTIEFYITDSDNGKVDICTQTQQKGDTHLNYTEYYFPNYSADDFVLTYLGNEYAKLSTSNYESATELPYLPGKYESVESRTLSKSTDSNNPVWNTICLPFAYTVPSGEGWKVLELTGFDVEASEENDDISFKFTKLSAGSTMVAGKPYLIMAPDDVALSASNIDVTNETSPIVIDNKSTEFVRKYQVSMIGSFVRTLVPEGAYGLKNGTNELWRMSKAVYMKGYRAYFTVERLDGEGDINVSLSSVRMSYLENEEEENITALDGIKLNTTPRGDIYDLTGRRITSPSKGIYIVNGKKFIK